MFLPQNSSNLQDEENDNEFLPNQSQSYHSIVLEHQQRRSLILAEHSSLPSQGLPSVANVSRPSNRQESRVSSQQPAMMSRNDQWRHDKQEDDEENEFMLDQNSLAEQISKALVREGSHLDSNSHSKHFQDHMENDQPSALWQHSNKPSGLQDQKQNSQDNPFAGKSKNIWKEESLDGLDNFSKSQKSQSKEKNASEQDSKIMKSHEQSQQQYFNLEKKSNEFQSKFDQEPNMNRFQENYYPNQQSSGESDPFRQQNESNNNFPGQLHSNIESNPLRSSLNRQSIQKTQSKRESSDVQRPNQSSSSVNQQDTVSRGEIKIQGNSLSQLMMQDRMGESVNQSHSGRDSLKFRQVDSIAGGSSQAVLQSQVNLYVKPPTKQILSKKSLQSSVLRQTQRENEDFAQYSGLNKEEQSVSHHKSSNIDLEDYNDLVNQIQLQDYAVKSSNLELRSNKSALLPSGMEPEQIMQSQQSHLERSQSADKQNNSKDQSHQQLNIQSEEAINWKDNESHLKQRSKLSNQSNEQSNNLKNTTQIKKLEEQELEKQLEKSSSVVQQSQNNSYRIEDKTVQNMKPNFAQNSSQLQQEEKSSSRYNYQSHYEGQIRNQSSKQSNKNMQNPQNSKEDQKKQYNFESHENNSSKRHQRQQNSNIINNRSNIFEQQYAQKQSQQSNLSKQPQNQRQEPQWQRSYSKTSEVRENNQEYESKSGRNYRIQESELSRIQMNHSQIIDQPHFKRQHHQPSIEKDSFVPSQSSHHSSIKNSQIKRQINQQQNKSSFIKNSQISGQKSYLKGSNSQLSNVKSQSSKMEIGNKSKVLSQINSVTKKQSYLKDNNYQKPTKDHKEYFISSSNNQQTNSTLFKKKEETKDIIFNTFPEEQPLISQSHEHNIEHDHVTEKKMLLSPINQTKNQLDKREKILSLRTPESKTKKKTQQKEDQIERIRLLKESQKKRLERELEKVKKELEQIQTREKNAEKIERQNDERIPKQQEKLSMHNRHKRQSEAVLKLVKEHRKSREQQQQQFQDLDRNITNNLMELSRIRQQAQIKNKEKKRLEIMERMKKNEMRRIQEQKLIKANIQYVQQFRSPEADREKEKEIVKDKEKDIVRMKGKDRDIIAEKQRNMSRERERNVDRQKERERNVITQVKITKLRSVGKRRKDDVYQARLD